MPFNKFAVARLFLLSLLANLHIFILVAAAWMAHNSMSAHIPVSGAAVALILSSIVYLLMVLTTGTVWCLRLSYPLLASLKFECLWSAAITVYEIGAALAVTAYVPPAGAPVTVSGSRGMLIAVSWVTIVISTTNLAGLIFSGWAHRTVFPEVWSAPGYSIEWFVHLNLADADAFPQPDSWALYIKDIEAGGCQKPPVLPFAGSNTILAVDHKTSEKAPWAPQIRRGVDEPFTVSPARETPLPLRPGLNTALPPLPLRVQNKSTGAGSRFVERFRESRLFRKNSTSPRELPFPASVVDHDKPIPIPQWSSHWLRADGGAQAGRARI